VYSLFLLKTPAVIRCELDHQWFLPYQVALLIFFSMDLGDTKNTVISMETNKLKVGQKVQISIEDVNGEEAWSSDVRSFGINQLRCRMLNVSSRSLFRNVLLLQVLPLQVLPQVLPLSALSLLHPLPLQAQ
jgi:hypothetical protein